LIWLRLTGNTMSSIDKKTRRLGIINLGVLLMLIPSSNVVETISGTNASSFALISTATIGNTKVVPGIAGAHGSSGVGSCVQRFTYPLSNVQAEGFYRVYGRAYNSGCRPGIDLKYKFGDRVKIYVSTSEIDHTDFSRWGLQSWFLLQQVVHCLIVLAVTLPWLISNLDGPLPWWLKRDNDLNSRN